MLELNKTRLPAETMLILYDRSVGGVGSRGRNRPDSLLRLEERNSVRYRSLNTGK